MKVEVSAILRIMVSEIRMVINTETEIENSRSNNNRHKHTSKHRKNKQYIASVMKTAHCNKTRSPK